MVGTLSPQSVLQPLRRRRQQAECEQVDIVDGPLIPVRDRSLAARSRNCRCSVDAQIAVDANTRLVVAVGDPVPGNHNECTACRDSGIDRAPAGWQAVGPWAVARELSAGGE